MKKVKKYLERILLIMGGIVFIILACFLLFSIQNNKIEIDFLDVGQGDASLIKLPNNKVILIDGGPDNLVIRRLGENLSFYRRKIDLVILSHAHDDHLIGLIEVMRRFKVKTIIIMNKMEKSLLLDSFLSLVKNKKVKVIYLENMAEIDYPPDCFLKLLNPLNLNVKNDTNNSLITKLTCGDFSVLWTGDNSEKVEGALLKTNQDWSAKIFKAAHHGSRTANSEMFLKTIRASLVIISVGISNRFGHPNAEILNLLDRLKIEARRTDQESTIKIYHNL